MTQAFYLGVYEVTQQQWKDVMGNNPSWHSAEGGGRDAVRDVASTDDFPVEMVSYIDVGVFIARLNEAQKGTGWRYRLPYEAEWEYACRAGRSEPEPFSF